jgi:ribosomal-protein-alanine N-acetyltransferase
LEPGDVDTIFRLRSDDIVNQYITRPKAKDKDEAREWMDKIERFMAEGASVLWGISLKDNRGLIGTITLWNLSQEKACGELGYDLLPEHHGQRIMSEAVAAVIDYGFSVMNLERIEAFTHRENKGSTSLLEKAGLRRDDELENELVGKEEPETTVIYALER